MAGWGASARVKCAMFVVSASDIPILNRASLAKVPSKVYEMECDCLPRRSAVYQELSSLYIYNAHEFPFIFKLCLKRCCSSIEVLLKSTENVYSEAHFH
jgi:hypothetical protein